jgi:hypothetical protein
MTMNDIERADLDFFMNLSEKEWEEFLNDSPRDDIEYALRLINTRRAEEMIEEMEKIESKQDRYGLDCTQAKIFINRVKQGVSK